MKHPLTCCTYNLMREASRAVLSFSSSGSYSESGSQEAQHYGEKRDLGYDWTFSGSGSRVYERSPYWSENDIPPGVKDQVFLVPRNQPCEYPPDHDLFDLLYSEQDQRNGSAHFENVWTWTNPSARHVLSCNTVFDGDFSMRLNYYEKTLEINFATRAIAEKMECTGESYYSSTIRWWNESAVLSFPVSRIDDLYGTFSTRVTSPIECRHILPSLSGPGGSVGGGSVTTNFTLTVSK